MVEATKLSLANTANSLRTIVPIHIIKQMNLKQGDHIEWNLDKDGNSWIAIIKKKE